VVAEERDRGARRMGGGGVEDSRVSEVFVRWGQTRWGASTTRSFSEKV
jgi:hypothetical protein